MSNCHNRPSPSPEETSRIARTIRWGLASLGTAIACWANGQAAARDAGAGRTTTGATQEASLDFESDIRPILASRCVRCHGADAQEGELRLDSPEFAAAGGHTGSSILGNDSQSSELYRRLTSDDPDYRMPREGEPLAPDEIAKFREWLDQGAPWPIASGSLEAPTAGQRWLVWLEPVFRRFERWFKHVRPIALPILGFLIAVYVIERAKHRQRVSRAETVAAEGLATIRREWYLVVGLALLLAGVWSYHARETQATRVTASRLEDRIAELTAEFERPTQRTPLGGPVPPRPNHRKQLGGVYFRGNDERDPRLFNGGFYRTATMTVGLQDGAGRALKWLDPAGDGPLVVALEIQRSVQATPALFSEKIMESVFLSRQIALVNPAAAADTPVFFETIEPDQRWIARYPIGSASGRGPLSGMIYVYLGKASDGVVQGKFHYGIYYDVEVVDGAISSESEIWMGSLSVPNGLLIPPPDRMLLNEWFDFRPIPEIEGENSTDPALLGIPEYGR
jgi:hypothetical protein